MESSEPPWGTGPLAPTEHTPARQEPHPRVATASEGDLDTASLAALRDGQESALSELIRRWEAPLFAFAWRYVQNTADAHDLVAEAFVRLYRQREKLRPDTRLSAWLFTTLANLCHHHHRWKRRHPTVSLDAPDASTGLSIASQTASSDPTPCDEAERDEAISALRIAIDLLPHELKTTLILHHYAHLSYREIGRVTGCSERGVETRLYRAKQRLRDAMGAHLAGETAGT